MTINHAGKIGLNRRSVVRLLGGSACAPMLTSPALGAAIQGPVLLTIGDAKLAIAFDSAMRTRISIDGKPLTSFDASEVLLQGGKPASQSFLFTEHSQAVINDFHGVGTRHSIRGLCADGVEKALIISFYDRHPGFATLVVRYHNGAAAQHAFSGWRSAAHVLPATPGGAWTYSGASFENRRDWIQPVTSGFDQRNFMGMNASDYGGGTPVADVWRRDAGLAVGHVERVPRLVALPVTAVSGGTRLAVESGEPFTLAPGQSFSTPECFIAVHRGDHFAPLDRYRRVMAERGISAPPAPATSYDPIWCAWGYERNFTVDEIVGTLPKAKSIGFEAAVLDDGWQTSEGDWKVDRKKFARGDDDMKSFASAVIAQGMKPRLWLSPLAVDPGTDLLHEHSDWLLLDRNGAVQDVTWWNAFTLCPAHPPVIDYYKKLVAKIIGEWGYGGLKLDGQHLNGVAPCYNPAHNHKRPEESFEKLQDFWKALYDTAIAINPDTVVELCPCGTAFAFHNVPAMNQTPASDPESSWQVRLKGKSLKALVGPTAAYSGDHVELSDSGEDFASSFGIGAVVSTKFTWPADTPNPSGDKLPPGGYVLTPQKEALWRKWVALYRDKMLSTGHYRGELYDLGFDRPEAHVIDKSGTLHYAFYAKMWHGNVELRGLGDGQYHIRDGCTGNEIGTVDRKNNHISVSFERFLLIEAEPVGKSDT